VGGGWFASSATRGQTSTLTAAAQIDLRSAQSPELSFWQRATLSSGDTVAVDLSLDGGLSWLPLDQQVGAAFDWTLRTVDLKTYRGQMVQLRFRLDTLGTVPEGAPTVGWWIDDLAVVDMPVVPPVPPTVTPIPTEVPTLTPVPTEIPADTLVPPTVTPVPTEVPTVTPVPTEIPTDTPVPPTVTPIPTEVPTVTAVPTEVPTQTPVPTEVSPATVPFHN
jgi:hypothetical protein